MTIKKSIKNKPRDILSSIISSFLFFLMSCVVHFLVTFSSLVVAMFEAIQVHIVLAHLVAALVMGHILTHTACKHLTVVFQRLNFCGTLRSHSFAIWIPFSNMASTQSIFDAFVSFCHLVTVQGPHF